MDDLDIARVDSILLNEVDQDSYVYESWERIKAEGIEVKKTLIAVEKRRVEAEAKLSEREKERDELDDLLAAAELKLSRFEEAVQGMERRAEQVRKVKNDRSPNEVAKILRANARLIRKAGKEEAG